MIQEKPNNSAPSNQCGKKLWYCFSLLFFSYFGLGFPEMAHYLSRRVGGGGGNSLSFTRQDE